MKKETIILIADTESTQPKEGATVEEVRNFKTEVWACGFCEIGGKNMRTFTNIDDMFCYIADTYSFYDVKVYFHNLAWDGMLVIDNLLRNKGFEWTPDSFHVTSKKFTTVISDKGQWYSLKFRWGKTLISCLDSLKILPFTVDKIAKDFGTKHKKLKGTIDYTVERHKDGTLTEEEKRYLENDIYVMAEALEMVEEYGLLDHMTIGSACLDTFKDMMGLKKYNYFFPKLEKELDDQLRPAYRGGWCYVNPAVENKILKNKNGRTYDVNSEYPYALHSKTLPGHMKHIYPVGLPIGRIEDELQLMELIDNDSKPFIVKIRAHFKLKEGKFPFIQIKTKLSPFAQNEYITDSLGDVELTLSKPDFILFIECYETQQEIEVLDGWIFQGTTGLFDAYIDKWMKVKEEATKTGNKCLRTLAKLFLNNLYGKLATSLIANYNVPKLEKDRVHFSMEEDTKNGVYLPAGIFCTAYARDVIVHAAINNHDIFDYCDTDSIHTEGEAQGIVIDPYALGAFKEETRWDKARFVRQKTYVEHVTHEDGELLDVPSWNLKACGAPESVKERILRKVELDAPLEKCTDPLSDDYGKIYNQFRTDDEILERFTFGLVETGKLARRSACGGTILVNTTFQIKK